MKEQIFLVTQNFKSPYVVMTGNGRNPQSIQYRAFAKGDQVKGVLHFENKRPAFVMVDGTYVIPLCNIKQVVVKDVVISNATGSPDTASKSSIGSFVKKEGNQKYIDAAIVGTIVGLGANWYAEKKGWIMPDKKNKFIAMGIGALMASYIVYRMAPKAHIIQK